MYWRLSTLYDDEHFLSLNKWNMTLCFNNVTTCATKFPICFLSLDLSTNKCLQISKNSHP